MPSPSLTGLNAPTFNENTVNATAQVIDSDVTFTDADNDFNGGTLVVSGLLAEDTVGLLEQGNGAGQIHIDGMGTVFYGGVQIGYSSGGHGASFTVTFLAAATSVAIDALIQDLTYANSSDTPTATRTLTFNVTDAAGHTMGGTPGFQEITGASNPFSAYPVNGYHDGNTGPTLVDLDHDGDLDLVLTHYDGDFLYFENTGTAASATFTARTGASNPFNGLTNHDIISTAAFVDIDGDNDLDLVAGSAGGGITFFRNTGTAAAPTFVEVTGASNPFDGVNIGRDVYLGFGDFDGDGDQDVVIGPNDGTLHYFENTGSSTAPVFVERTGGASPFSAIDVGNHAHTLARDIDHDGDLDLVIGAYDGTIHYFENTGTASAGVFTERTGAANPYGSISSIGLTASVGLGDIDNDGDLDIFMGSEGGAIHFYLDTSLALPTVIVGVTAQGEVPVAAGAPSDVTVVEDVASNLDLSAISLSDPDTAGSISVVLTASTGTMTASSGGGVTVTNSGTGAVTLAGTVSAIDTFLNTASAIQYTGALNVSGNDAATLTITADDGSGAVTVATVNIDITGVNDAPTLTGLSSSVTFLENTVNATPQLIDTDVTFGDVEGNLTGGHLTVSGLLAEDSVGLLEQGNGAGQIHIDGMGSVFYGGVQIGNSSGGHGASFTVTFLAAATSAAVDALIQDLTYANSSDTPTASRDLTINVFDASGASLAVVGSTTYVEQTGAANPFNANNTGNEFQTYTAGAFADLDGDGDLDLVAGDAYGTLTYFRNTGTSANPAFTRVTGGASPVNGLHGSFDSMPAFADMDHDGDQDLILGDNSGGMLYFENTGTSTAPVFVQRTGAANPFNGLAVGPSGRSAITLADLDGDGDLDLLSGNYDGELHYFENTGTSGAAVYVERTGGANPFNGIGPGTVTTPDLADRDGDGDLDLVVGAYDGKIYYFENTGTASAPVFVQRTGAANPFNAIDVGSASVPRLVDLNGDGQLDLIVAEQSAFINTFLNVTPVTVPTITINVTAEADGPTGAADNLTYGGTADIISALGGDDVIDGGGGDDIIDGGSGHDILIGGAGADYLKGGTGADDLFGGTGNDTYVIDNVGDTADETGGDGTDLVISSVAWTLGAGFENLTLAAPGGAINGTGNSQDNVILGNSFANTLSGLDGNDTLTGGGGNDTLNGGDGNDSLDGGGQNDTLNGGAGTDTLVGGIGNDVLDGGTGADAMTGGLGNDSYVVDDAGDVVTEAVGEGTDTVSASISYSLTVNVENLTLTGSGDIDGTGNALKNTIIGNSGANTIHGGGDIDTISGMDGADTLYGDAGNDVLGGGNGDDFLIGGAGSDRLTGGAGADTFVFTDLDIHRFSAGAGLVEKDTITDLSFAANDRIDLSAIDANVNLGGDQAFSFVGKFTKVAGQAVMAFNGSVTTLQLDVDGDGRADFMIAINGDVTGTTANHYTGAGDSNGGWVL